MLVDTLQACCRIDGIAGGRVVEVLLTTKIPNHGDPVIDADSSVPEFEPLPALLNGKGLAVAIQLQRTGDGALGVIVLIERRVEYDVQAVADDFVQGTAVLEHDLTRAVQILIHGSDEERGLGALGERRVVREIGEQEGCIAALATEL